MYFALCLRFGGPFLLWLLRHAFCCHACLLFSNKSTENINRHQREIPSIQNYALHEEGSRSEASSVGTVNHFKYPHFTCFCIWDLTYHHLILTFSPPVPCIPCYNDSVENIKHYICFGCAFLWIKGTSLRWLAQQPELETLHFTKPLRFVRSLQDTAVMQQNESCSPETQHTAEGVLAKSWV